MSPTPDKSPAEFPVYLDLPRGGIVDTPYDQLWGWMPESSETGVITFATQGKTLTHARIRRPDLAGPHYGFSAYLDLASLFPSGRGVPAQIEIAVLVDGKHLTKFPLTVHGIRAVDLDDQRRSADRRRTFVAAHCGQRLRKVPGCHALNALPRDWPLKPQLSEKTDATSAHFYGPSIIDFLKTLPPETMVLDAGAGFRKLPYPNVVNLEIYDYPSTDILASGDELPFEDATFDAVLSLAVLVHVRDPFRCADEITRVLKPGGKVLAMVAFLQAEHGYPSHFFNATRFGVRALFEELHLESQFLDPSNHPVHTMKQILSRYASGLSPEARGTFMQSTVADILTLDDNSPMVQGIDPEVAWQVAWGTTSIFSKNG